MMPLIGALFPGGSEGYKEWTVVVRGKQVHIGLFLADVVNFLIVALALFIFIQKFLGFVLRTKKEEIVPPPPLTRDQELLTGDPRRTREKAIGLIVGAGSRESVTFEALSLSASLGTSGGVGQDRLGELRSAVRFVVSCCVITVAHSPSCRQFTLGCREASQARRAAKHGRGIWLPSNDRVGSRSGKLLFGEKRGLYQPRQDRPEGLPHLPGLHELRRARARSRIPGRSTKSRAGRSSQAGARSWASISSTPPTSIPTARAKRSSGRALRDFAKRDEVVIATKVHGRMRPGPNGRGLSRKAIFMRDRRQPAAAGHRLCRSLPDPSLGLRRRRSRRRWKRCTTW